VWNTNIRNLSVMIFKIHYKKDDNFKINYKIYKLFEIQVYIKLH